MGRATLLICTSAIVAGLAACGGGYSWDSGLSESERDDRVAELLAEVDVRLEEEIDPRAFEAGSQMSDDEIVTAAEELCKGLNEGGEQQEIAAEVSEEVDGFSILAVGIVGPPAVDVFCPDLGPQDS